MEYSKEYLKMAEEREREVAPGSKPARKTVRIASEAPITDAIRETIAVRRSAVTNGLSDFEIGVPGLAKSEPVTGKKVRHVFIEATFPELKGGQMYQHAHGEASGTKPAIARAFKNLLKTIPKKRISVISATISITTKTLEG